MEIKKNKKQLLDDKQLEQLEKDFYVEWYKGYSGMDIARYLGFGKKGSPYEKIPLHYIYYYRQTLGLPLRQKPHFAKYTPSANPELRRDRYVEHPEDIGLMRTKTFIRLLKEYEESQIALEHLPEYYRKVMAYCTIHFFTPLRAGEIRSIKGEDIEIFPDYIKLNILREKKGHHKLDRPEPINIPRVLPCIAQLTDYLEDYTGKDKLTAKPFDFSRTTSMRYVKEFFGERYFPHYFRYNYISNLLNRKNGTILKVKSKTRLTSSAIEHYIVTPARIERQVDEETIEEYRKEGLIE